MAINLAGDYVALGDCSVILYVLLLELFGGSGQLLCWNYFTKHASDMYIHSMVWNCTIVEQFLVLYFVYSTFSDTIVNVVQT